jgi:glycosidase
MTIPRIYQINTVPFLKQIGVRELDQIPDAVLNALRYKWHIDYVYLLCVWERTEVEIDPRNPANRFLFGIDQACGDKPWNREDVITSGFSVKNYQVAEKIGGKSSYHILKKRINDRGMKVILDFVPNHTAHDHPWVLEHQDFYVHNTNGTIAAGQEKGSEPWGDTYQLDYSNPVFRFEMLRTLKEIAQMADGLRCDMAHCVMNDRFDAAWEQAKPFGKAADMPEFWTEVRTELGPDTFLMAECYHQTEYELITQGFDAVYDKDNGFYDRLLQKLVNNNTDESGNVESHIDGTYATAVQKHNGTASLSDCMVRFLENHDEERAVQVFGDQIDEAMEIFVHQYGKPSGYQFLHHGQLVGNKIKTPIQIGKYPFEQPNFEILGLYESLFAVDSNWREMIPAQFREEQIQPGFDWTEGRDG